MFRKSYEQVKLNGLLKVSKKKHYKSEDPIFSFIGLFDTKSIIEEILECKGLKNYDQEMTNTIIEIMDIVGSNQTTFLLNRYGKLELTQRGKQIAYINFNNQITDVLSIDIIDYNEIKNKIIKDYNDRSIIYSVCSLLGIGLIVTIGFTIKDKFAEN